MTAEQVTIAHVWQLIYVGLHMMAFYWGFTHGNTR